MNHVPQPAADEKVTAWLAALDETLDRGFVDPKNYVQLRELLAYLNELAPGDTDDRAELR
jgi:hypothetical protein